MVAMVQWTKYLLNAMKEILKDKAFFGRYSKKIWFFSGRQVRDIQESMGNFNKPGRTTKRPVSAMTSVDMRV